jgi:RNA recognition motif-containing protein
MSMSVQQLESIFKRYGSCRINLRHPRIDEEQHAFVTYTSLKEAQKAARGMNGAILHGERITAKVNVEGCSSPKLSDHTIKVEILAGHASEERLEEVFGFQEDIEILGITIKTPAIGPSYAYVYYSNEKDAQRAISELDGTMIDQSTLQVKSHTLKEKLEVNCEPWVVRIITSPDRPEYRSQIQSIEHANLVSIK